MILVVEYAKKKKKLLQLSSFFTSLMLSEEALHVTNSQDNP